MNLTAVEYFAGIGLVRLGLEAEGWRVTFANDIEPKKYKMYADYFGEEEQTYLIGDIHQLDATTVPSTDLATASFPCIDLSLAGNGAGLNGKHSGAFWGFIEILKQMGSRRPPLIMVENVVGWLHSHKGEDFRQAIASLNALGYYCDAFVLDAQHFTPQSRPRMFVIGSQQRPNGEDVYHHHLARPLPLFPNSLRSAIAQNNDLLWMGLDLPTPPPLHSDLPTIVEHLPDDDPQWWIDEKRDHLVSQMSPKHLALVKQLRMQEAISFATVFKRVRAEGTRAEVRADGVAGCLRTPVGGSSKQILLQLGHGTLRARWMTAREYARLQGVPDSYPINVPYIQALWGFGDAVCVPAIAWIARHALNPLAEELHLAQYA